MKGKFIIVIFILWSDVAGGYHYSILDTMRHAVQTSNTHQILGNLDGQNPVGFREAFRLATLGGSKGWLSETFHNESYVCFTTYYMVH